MSIKDFYLQAWRSSVASPAGRRVWLILILKIVILLGLFKVLFFKDALADFNSDLERSEQVRANLTIPNS